MASSTNAPFGFEPHLYPGRGEAPMLQVEVLAANGLAMAAGDAVTPTSAGGITRTGGTPGSASTDVNFGVIDSFWEQGASGLNNWRPYLAASVAAKAWITWHPHQLYRVQGDATPLALTQVYNNANHIDAAPSTVLSKSQAYLDIANAATTNTLGWKILDYYRVEWNQIGDTYAVYVVMNNRRFLGNQIAGV